MLIDHHNHSLHSFDGSVSVAEILAHAEGKGLTAFAVTDHCDTVGDYDFQKMELDIAASVDEVKAWREKHDTRCKMLCGIELGDPIDNLAFAEKMLAMREYDVVIGSIHSDGVADYYFGSFDTQSEEELEQSVARYYARQLELVRWGKFDILAHLTYPLRYIVGDYGRRIDFERQLPVIDELFKRIIDKGISLEVNTSGLRQKLGKTLPDEALLRRYYELGGRLITPGSDSHQLEYMSFGMDETEAMLRRIGFGELTWFKERKMQKIQLSSSLSDKNPV